MTAIFGPQMTPTLSGAIAYEWVQEANNYGIIQYPDTTIQDGVTVPIGSPIPMQPEFDNLKSVWAAVSPSSTALSAYTPPTTTMVCPATTAGWSIDPSAALPPSPSAAPTTFTFSPADTETGSATGGSAQLQVSVSGNGSGSSTGGASSGTASSASTATSTAGRASLFVKLIIGAKSGASNLESKYAMVWFAVILSFVFGYSA